jgi:hypothetical protein
MTISNPGLWMTDPRDGLDHAFHEVVAGGRWKSRCPAGIVADPATLTDPEDQYGRCEGCLLALAVEHGTELADRAGDSTWRP